MSTYRAELVSLALRVSAAALVTYVSIKYMVRYLDPNYKTTIDAKKKVQELMTRLNIDFPLELNEYEIRIATQLVPPDEGVDFTAIGGYENVVGELQNRVIKPLRARSSGRLPVASNLLNPARGILFYGPPGCGKTLIARAMAKAANARFIQLDLSTLTDKWYGESQKLAAAVFSLASKVQPCIIFIDEIDSFLSMRKQTDQEATGMMKAQFMSLWDGFSTTSNSTVIVMGATNRPHDIDAAICRRMPTRFFINLPDEDARAKILQTVLRDEYADTDIDFVKVAKQTRNMSGSDLKEVCRIAALSRLEEIEDTNIDWIDPALITIREKDLFAAVTRYSRDAVPTFADYILEETE